MKQDVKERLNQLGQEILTISRNEIYVSMRFFESAFGQFAYELNLSTQSIGTDGSYIFFNPKHLMELYDKTPAMVNRTYLHMLLHYLFCHPFHRPDYADDARWDLSCDIAAESVLDSFEDITCVVSCPSAFREEVYAALKKQMDVLTAEGIYKYIPAIFSAKMIPKLEEEFYVDDHAFWPQKQENQKPDTKNRQPQTQIKQMQETWEEISKKTQTAMETLYQQMGDAAGSLKTALSVKNRRRDNYAAFLRKFAALQEELRLDDADFDYIPYCFGLSGFGIGAEKVPLIEPLEYSEHYGIDEFAIAIDTSGSLSKDQIQVFLETTCSILMSEETFFRKMQVHVIQCDAAIQNDQIIRNRDDLEKILEHFTVSGFGGTDFTPVFSYLEQLCAKGIFHHLRGLIYFTDGFGKFPETYSRPVSFDTAFIIPAGQAYEPAIPAWAVKVVMEI